MGRILRKDVRARELIDDRGEATVASLIDERQRIAKGAFGGLLLPELRDAGSASSNQASWAGDEGRRDSSNPVSFALFELSAGLLLCS